MHFEAARQRRQQEHNDRAWLAWHTAALPNLKEFPKLQELIVRVGSGGARRQSSAEQVAILKSLVKAYA